ncbi:MAG: prolipoprotein diacylglyceryl transferase [Clostridiaceae bacterium]
MYLHLLQPFASAMKLPSRVAFSVAGFDIYWSGLLLAVGIIAAILLAQAETKRKKLPDDTAVDLCLIGIPLGVICARLAYVFLHFSYYKADPLMMLYFWDGGLSVYGAVAGVLAGIVVYSLAKKLKFFALTDLLAPGLLLAQGFALWGNFFDQTNYGAEVTSSALGWFPFAVLIEKTDTIHYAVFFYEFVWCALIFAALWFIVRKRARRDGAMTLWYVLLYGAGHFALEFLRQGSEYVFLNINFSQLLCASLALAALLMLIIRAKKPVPAIAAEPAPETDSTPEDQPSETVKPADEAAPDGESATETSETDDPSASPEDESPKEA